MTTSSSETLGRVLVADDDEDVLGLVAFDLEAAGYAVSVARNGVEALAMAVDEPADLAILDGMMPGLDGFEVTRRIREHAELRSLPIILLTARAGETDVVHGLDAGANEYVKKPFSPRDLRARVRNLIDLSRETASDQS